MSEVGTPNFEPHGALAASSLVDADNPWLGLDSFTEETRQFFCGRNAEIAELARRVQRKVLTILFGQSGLGKTSILRAGIVPRLRREGYCPVYVRIDYSADSPPPSEQIKAAIFTATASWGIWSRPGAAVAAESLWEFLHHRDDVLRDSSGKALTPLLIFDQFEEIFTLAQDDAFGRKRATEFMENLADLVENRAPKVLEEKLEGNDTLADRFDFGRLDYRILIALREDYLAHLEGLKGAMPSITQNRMRLARMTGKQALEAVMKPGGDLVTQEVAESIVRFVAGDAELVNAEVEPALLSVVCRELNNARVAQGRREISADLLAGSHDSILSEFYERVLADQPAGVRRFIEDQMVTESGYRENLAEERVLKAFAAAGAAPTALATLVNRRLLRIEERLDMRRVELTHDVLCDVVKASRDVRQQRESREDTERLLEEQRVREAATRKSLVRARQIAAGSAVLAIVAIASAIFGYQNMKRVQQAELATKRTHQMAEGARAEAEKLVVYMLEDLYGELEPVGRLDVVGELSKRALDYYAALPPELRTGEAERNRALALARSGAVQDSQGKIDEARKTLDAAIAILDRLRREGDRSEVTAIGLSMALVAKGHVLTDRLQTAEAESASAKAVEVLRPFMSGPSPSARLRRAYGGAMRFRGSAQLNTNLAKEAVKTLDIARETFRGIDGLGLGDLAAAIGFADASSGEAWALHDLGRDDEARRIAEEGARIASLVLERRPGHIPALRIHARNLSVLTFIEANELHVRKSLMLEREIERDWNNYVELDPGNAVAWGELGDTHAVTGVILESDGRPTESIAEYRASMALEPKAPTLSTFFLWSAGHIALLEADMGHDQEASKALADCHALAARSAAKIAHDPSRRTLILDECVNADGWVALYGEMNLQARGVFEERIRQLKAIKPGKALQELDIFLERQYVGLAWASYGLNDFAAAERDMRQAIVYRELQHETTPSNKVEISGQRIFVALAVVRQGRLAEAREMIGPELRFQRGLRAAGDDSEMQRLLVARALLVATLASPEQARTLLPEALAIMDRLRPDMKRRKSVAQLRRWISQAWPATRVRAASPAAAGH